MKEPLDREEENCIRNRYSRFGAHIVEGILNARRTLKQHVERHNLEESTDLGPGIELVLEIVNLWFRNIAYSLRSLPQIQAQKIVQAFVDQACDLAEQYDKYVRSEMALHRAYAEYRPGRESVGVD